MEPALLTGLGVSLVALGIYVFTLSPTVNFVDSGELITVGATAGIAHPPGYPLYTLLTILAAALPAGDVAVRVNAVSALAAALAAGLFYALVYEMVRHHWRRPRAARPAAAGPPAGRPAAAGRGRNRAGGPGATPGKSVPVPPADAAPPPRPAGRAPLVPVAVAAGSALLLATSTTFWSWATQAKMYSLHYVFVAGLFWLALCVRRAIRQAPAPGPRWPPTAWPRPARLLAAVAAVAGLALTNHSMAWLLLPGLAVLLLWPVGAGGAPPWRWLLHYLPGLLLAGALPLMIYLYLPLRAAQHPVLDWGTPDTWDDFWRHVTLWQSRVLLGRNTGTVAGYLGKAAGMALAQWGPLLGLPLFALAAGGLVRLARTNWALLTATLLTAVITLVQTFNFQNVEVAAYNVPLYMIVLLWAGAGLAWLISAGGAWLDAGAGSPAPAGTTGAVAGAPARAARILSVIPLVLAAGALAWNAGRSGHRDDYLAAAYVQNAFQNFAPNALVLTNNWYLVSPSYYLQYVQHTRPDVAIIDRKLIQYPFYADYADRQYPAVMAPIKDLEVPFIAAQRRWVNGEPSNAQEISRMYFDMIHALITRQVAAGRPVYLQWDDPGPEEDFISKDLATHPEGLALRVDAQPFTGTLPDPQFDWRGILTNPVPKDELAHAVIDSYPVVLDRLAAFAGRTNHPADATRFSGEATQIRRALGLPVP